MDFTIIGEITSVETFATGSGIREIARLRRIYGRGRWRKRKGIAKVRLADSNHPHRRGTLVSGDRHRQERVKIKHFL